MISIPECSIFIIPFSHLDPSTSICNPLPHRISCRSAQMSDPGPSHRRGAIHRRSRWPAAILSLVRLSRSSTRGRDSDISASTRRLRRLSRRALSDSQPAVRVPTGHPSTFRDLHGRERPASAISYTPSLIGIQVPLRTSNSPALTYHSLGHFGTPRPSSLGRSSSAPSISDSIPEYEDIERGPPTDHEDYGNFIVPGMEMDPDIQDPV